MVDINNPWIVGIGVTVIGGLLLRFVFGIGKPTEPKYSVSELKDMFSKSNQLDIQNDIKGDKNIIINITVNKNE